MDLELITKRLTFFSVEYSSFDLFEILGSGSLDVILEFRMFFFIHTLSTFEARLNVSNVFDKSMSVKIFFFILTISFN